MRILIAEDETIIRLDLRELLERAGFEVCAEARDGEEAVSRALDQPDLALLDVKMPHLDGIEAARRILEERPIPIVMVTAYGEEELVSRAVEVGVFGYLVKPFRESDLAGGDRHCARTARGAGAVRAEAVSLSEALAARKAIERAKGLLMEREALTEQDAFARLRKASQISGKPLRVVAEALVATSRPIRRRGTDGMTTPRLGVRALARAEQPLVGAPAERPPTPPGSEADEHERADEDEREEHDRRLPGEDLHRLVERPVKPGRRSRHRRRTVGDEAELDRGQPRLCRLSGAIAPQSRELGAGGRTPCRQRGPGLRVDARVLDLRCEAGDALLQPCDALAERVDRLLQVVDLNLLSDDRAK